jgi:hypothetical protein
MTFRNRLRARTRTRALTTGVPLRHNALTADQHTLAAWNGGVGVAGATIYQSRTASGVQVGNQLVIAGQVLRGDT